jgi:hypothetical protein
MEAQFSFDGNVLQLDGKYAHRFIPVSKKYLKNSSQLDANKIYAHSFTPILETEKNFTACCTTNMLIHLSVGHLG